MILTLNTDVKKTQLSTVYALLYNVLIHISGNQIIANYELFHFLAFNGILKNIDDENEN